MRWRPFMKPWRHCDDWSDRHWQTMRRFDDACPPLTPIRPLTPGQIKAIREKEHVSQTVFANYLNVTSSLVSNWERGEKRPSGASLKLLTLVEKNGLATVA